MFKSILFTVFSVISFGAISQVELDFTSKVNIFPNLGIVQVKYDSQYLQCYVEPIESFDCGTGTVTNDEGQCVVSKEDDEISSSAFGLDYVVNDVESCWGTGGTPEWQGLLPPYSGGSGSFSKNIFNGVTEDNTTFQLNCDTSSSFGFEGKVVSSTYAPFVVNKKSHKLIIWDGFGSRIIEKSGYSDDIILESKKVNADLALFIAITDKAPTKQNNLFTYKPMNDSSGLCSTLGEDGYVGLHISPSPMFQNTCGLEPLKQYYLVKVIMQGGKRKSLNPYLNQ